MTKKYITALPALILAMLLLAGCTLGGKTKIPAATQTAATDCTVTMNQIPPTTYQGKEVYLGRIGILSCPGRNGVFCDYLAVANSAPGKIFPGASTLSAQGTMSTEGRQNTMAVSASAREGQAVYAKNCLPLSSGQVVLMMIGISFSYRQYAYHEQFNVKWPPVS